MFSDSSNASAWLTFVLQSVTMCPMCKPLVGLPFDPSMNVLTWNSSPERGCKNLKIVSSTFEFCDENLLQALLRGSCWYGAKNALAKVWHSQATLLLTCTERKENDRDYGQLKPTLCWPAGVTQSGQECSPRLISLRTNSAASTYYVQWIINARASTAELSWLAS